MASPRSSSFKDELQRISTPICRKLPYGRSCMRKVPKDLESTALGHHHPQGQEQEFISIITLIRVFRVWGLGLFL